MICRLFISSFLLLSVQAKSYYYDNQQCYDKHNQVIPCQWTKAGIIASVVVLVVLSLFLLLLCCCCCCRCRASRCSKASTTPSVVTSNSVLAPYSRGHHFDVEASRSKFDNAGMNGRTTDQKRPTWNEFLSQSNIIAVPKPTLPPYSRY